MNKIEKDSFGNRIKNNYENPYRIYLTRRMPVILRIDGVSFHTFTKGMDRPFDDRLIACMQATAKTLCEKIQGAKISYGQSDEISILLTDYDKLDTDAWFGYNLSKVCSVAASIATMAFNIQFALRFLLKDKESKFFGKGKEAYFDCRAFNIPKEEVTNYFYWRQRDSTKNSISMLAQSNFSHKELQNLNSSQLQDKLMLEKSINWNDLPATKKRGSCIIKSQDGWKVDENIPIFSQDRNYIDQYVYIGET